MADDRTVRRRAALLGGGLVAVSLVIGGMAVASEAARRIHPRSGGAPGRRAATPVLSVRRTPELAVRPQADRRLRSAIDDAMAGAPPGHCLVIGIGGHTALARNPDEPLSAASNQKLLTASAVLDAFEGSSTFSTRIASAAPVDGVVTGDVWVVGGGDPVIDSDTYQASIRFGPTPHTSAEAMADAIVAAGVRSITGAVRGDDTRYDAQRTIPTWPGRYVTQNQVGPLSALALNDGKTFPVIAGTGGTPVPAPDPPAAFASGLTDLLRARGVTVTGAPGSGRVPPDLSTLIEVPSLTVAELVREMLTWSDNNTAELLLKELGRRGRDIGTTDRGIAAVRADLEAKHLSLRGVELVDGSGLDPSNRVTCRLLDGVLAQAGPSGPLADGLAVAGTSGTLRDRFRGTDLVGHLRAKTGTLRGVSALSGWVDGTAGPVRFSLVLNTTSGELSAAQLAVEQRVPAAIAAYPDTVDPASLAPAPPR